MRVHVIRRRDEEGAVAVFVAILAIAIIVVAGVVVDLGVAYTNKRQLQAGADAGALAAAKIYTQEDGTCAELRDDPALEGTARAAADAVATKNRSGQVNDEFVVECVTSGPYEGALQITYGNERDTPTYFFFPQDGSTDEPIKANARSKAVVYVPGTELKLRPYGLCSTDVPDVSEMPTDVREIKMPGQAHGGSDCPSAQSGGNWWFMSCPGTGSSGMSPHEIADALRDGCENGAEVVSPQDPSSPSALSSSLTANCSSQADVSPSCLDADTGNSSLANPSPVSAWGDILGKTIVVPVFCDTPTCSPTTVDGAGTGRVYPVFKLAAVVVCGYHIYDKGSDTTSDGDCAGNTFDDSYAELLGCTGMNDDCLPAWDIDGTPAPNQKPKETIRLFLRFVQEVSGTEVIGCHLGDDCDGGVRQVALSE